MLSTKGCRALLISRFKNAVFLKQRCEALASLPHRTGTPLTSLPCGSSINLNHRNPVRFNSNEVQHAPKLQKEKILSTVELVKREPLLKEAFKGKFDVNVLAFPEVLNPDEIANLEYMVEQVRYFFRTQVDSAQIDAEGKIPDHVMQGLRQLGLFSLSASEEYGGISLKETVLTQIMEICGTDPSIGLMLTNHQSFACHVLEKYGTPEQKAKYLPNLCSGECIGAICVSEETAGNDLGSIETKVEPTIDNDGYIINGKKIWVSNGGNANLFLVFGKCNVITYDGSKESKLGALIVERNTKGVTVHGNEDKLGVKGLSMCTVEFDNVTVPSMQLIDSFDNGIEIANDMLYRSRLVEAMLVSGLLKTLVNGTIQYAIQREQYGKPLAEYENVQEKVARIGTNAYAVESLVYLTAGLKDSTSNPDLVLESTAAKIFASETLWKCVNDCMDIFGARSYTKATPLERILRDAKVFSIVGGTNDVLRQFIASMGVKNFANIRADNIEEMRNPLFYPKANLKKMIEHYLIEQGRFKLKQDLAGFLHPSLKSDADELEKIIIRLNYTMELQLTRYGANVMDKQIILRRLADVITSIYAQTAVLSRSSRSYCIGLANADVELLMTTAFCQEQTIVVNKLLDELQLTDFDVVDPTLIKISQVLFKDKLYKVTNPVQRNW